MRSLSLIVLLLVGGCSSVSPCTEKEYSFILPSGIPFVDGSFTYRKTNTHVDCELDPDERSLPNG
jgi:hypothetical protein